MIVLDTNVLSELMKPAPAASVASWVGSQPSRTLHVTSITQAEILHGIMLLPRGRRRDAIQAAAASMFATEFVGRVLPFSSEAAEPYARIAVDRRGAGRPISHFDAQIAAIASCNGAILATRNTDDFTDCGVRLVNPWNEPA